MPRGRPKGEKPPMTSTERTRKHREAMTGDGKIEVRGIFLGPVGRKRIERLAEYWGITRSEAVGRALRLAEESIEAAGE